jgi:cyclic pyranopterin monophosphate synthase
LAAKKSVLNVLPRQNKFLSSVLPRQNKFVSDVLPRQNKFVSDVLPRQNKAQTARRAVAKNVNHLNADGAPTMVDISAKLSTPRVARAESSVRFPVAVAKALLAAGFISEKGAILHTAIIAGTMAAKRTHELIPFCHSLGLDRCEITLTPDARGQLNIACECSVIGKTGVEMEAMVGASVAALTVYDMTKALSLEIEIGPTYLQSKSGGKRQYVRKLSS